jgi:glyoxylase-like metal-dependent hydrolase (beta-lactamase superfamily II)
MDEIIPLDTLHDGRAGAICAWLVTTPVPVLVDPGPSTVMGAVHDGLAEAGVPPSDLRYIVATHAHLDHAGSAGSWIARYPHLKLLAHEGAAEHLVAPRRLVASTRLTFGEAHTRLWGEVVPVPAHAVVGLVPGERGPLAGMPAVSTPGHIDHHMAWVHEATGTLLAGDALGIVLGDEAPTHPATPAPSLDLAAWKRTLVEIEAIGAERGAVAHFGLHRDPGGRARALSGALTALADRVARAMAAGTVEEDAAAFHEEVVERLSPFRDGEGVREYFEVFSAANDYMGVVHHLTRRSPKAPRA